MTTPPATTPLPDLFGPAASAPAPAALPIIRSLRAAGFILFPLHGKVPPAGLQWREVKADDYTAEELSSGNYGIALPPHVVVIDIDPRNFEQGDQPHIRLARAVGSALSSFSVRTGAGGTHIYLRKPADYLTRGAHKDYPGIDFKSHGGYVVGPGSIHPDTGTVYTVGEGAPGTLAAAPQALLDLLKRTGDAFGELPGLGEYVNDAPTQERFVDYLEKTAKPSIQGKGGDLNAFAVACFGRDLGLPPATAWNLMVELWNPRCQPPWDDEELKAKVIHAYRYARGKIGNKHPKAHFDEIAVEGKPKEIPSHLPALPAKSKDVAWDQTIQGELKRTLHNLLNYLRVPEFGMSNLFGYNEFSRRYEFQVPAPWHRGRMPIPAEVTEHDHMLLKGYLATRHKFEVSVQLIAEAIANVAHERRFHPVREYLNGLKWDGTKRLDTWLTDYLGVEDSPYTRACARKTLCAAVMRVQRPGCKFDNVLILEGGQGLGKSTAVEILAGDWGCDAPIDPHSRDTVQLMQGHLIMEMAEMEVTRRAEYEALKAFITRKHDKARLAYGRTVMEFARQSIFIATKNPVGDGTYLTDEENRRWWPVTVRGMVDFKGLKAARNQLFAEAVVRCTAGERLDMDTPELAVAAKETVGLRQAGDPWEERIGMWLNGQNPPREFITTRDIYVDAMGGRDENFDQRAQKRAAGVLKSMGWVSHVRRAGKDILRGFIPKSAVKADSVAAVADLLGDL